MRDFFIWCSGASVEIVKKCDDKEISKYTNIGIVVFCVAFLSIFSATYFLSFAFNTEGTNFVWLYLPIGIIWGFIILSLDRAIVSTISKNDTLNIQILKSIPRVALALMIGIVVATPLEFKIFEKGLKFINLRALSRYYYATLCGNTPPLPCFLAPTRYVSLLLF